jgi:hypothetical protein
LELHERDMQLEHCQQLLSMQQNELQSEDMILKEICSTLKQYQFLLQGRNLTTEAMVSHYEVSICSFQLNDIIYVRFEVFTAVRMMMLFF